MDRRGAPSARLVGWVVFPQRRTLRPSRCRDMPDAIAGKRAGPCDPLGRRDDSRPELSNFPGTYKDTRPEKRYIGSKIQKKMTNRNVL